MLLRDFFVYTPKQASRKSFFLLAAAAALLFAFVGLPFVSGYAWAKGTEYTEGTLLYTVDGNSITITGYFGRNDRVEVPASIAGMPVNTIAAGAFAGTAVHTVVLPDCVTSMEAGAVPSGTNVVWANNPERNEVSGDASGGETAIPVVSNTADAASSASVEVGVFEADVDLDDELSTGSGSGKAVTKSKAGKSSGLFGSNAANVSGGSSIPFFAVAGVVLVALVAGVVIAVRKLRTNE